ncbi:MAG TPA: ABC transporter permease [Myxococcota bacterium]|nr:ABC transporter permease [Myxococcota bacterium]
MRAILSVASVTFRESIRNRTVLAVLLAAIGFICSALLLAAMALDQRERVIKDWGLFCVSFFGVLLAILIGVNLVSKELKRKTLYVVLSRPVHRFQYVIGKYLGMGLTLLAEVGALSAALFVLLAIEGVAPEGLIVKSLCVSLIEVLFVAALAIFFASFSSPYLSGFFTLALFVVGRSLPALNTLADKVDAPLPHLLLKLVYFVLPDFSLFNMSTRAVHGLNIPAGEVLLVACYGVGYLVLLLFLACLIFSRRDIS